MSSAYALNMDRSARTVVFRDVGTERDSGPALTESVRRDVARVVRTGWTNLPDAESQFLVDYAAGKYMMKGLNRLVRLHVGASSLSAAYALPDRLALHIAEQRCADAMTYDEASHAETVAVAAVDPVQHRVLSTRCPSKSLELLELLLRQRRTTDDLKAATMRLVKEGR